MGFLAAFANDLGTSNNLPSAGSDRSPQVAKLHERLMASDGKLPSLDELAREYGRSARRLNELFVKTIFCQISYQLTCLDARRLCRTGSHMARLCSCRCSLKANLIDAAPR